MYDFAAIALLGLALFKLVDVLEDQLPELTKFHGLLTVVLGVAGAFALDYSVFGGFDVAFREEWMGMAVTGLAVAGMTSAWRALFHWLGSSEGEEPAVRHRATDRLRTAA